MRNQNIFSSKKKTNYLRNGILLAIAVVLVLLAYFMNQPETIPNTPGTDINANGPIDTKGKEKENPKNDALTQAGEAYYLLKEDEGDVLLYYVEENGEEKLLRKTDIRFSLITEQDQIEFQNGIKVETEEELDSLLQDFES